MAERQSAAQAASAALAALERYSLHVGQLATRRLDAELYHTVSLDVDTIRLACQQLPAAATAWTGLLIAHAELMHGLWRTSRGEAADLAAQLARTRENVRRLQGICMRVAAPQD